MNIINKVIILLTILLSQTVFAQTTSQVSQAQLLSLQTAEKAPHFIVLDVRSADEFKQGHISNAVNIAHTDLEKRLTELTMKAHGDKSTLIIVHCRSGRRAAIAIEALRDNQFSNVKHLTGDINAWRQNNLPLVKE